MSGNPLSVRDRRDTTLSICRTSRLGKAFLIAACVWSFGFPSWLVRATWSDTDSDGSNDLWTDPSTLVATSLADMNLANLDADSDGATNAEEAVSGSNPFQYDTDMDGINDGDEIHLTSTNPLNWDSDSDDISDYDDFRGFSGVTYPGGVLPSIPGSSYSDYDADGVKNPDDPFVSDPTNYSSVNETTWGGDVVGDADGDGKLNFEDPRPYDADDDGIDDAEDPFPNDWSNYSPVNGITWDNYVFEDWDFDGILNYQDSHPYDHESTGDLDSDGLANAVDPAPEDATNYSSINGVTWYGDALNHSDADNIANWYDAWPYDTTNGDGSIDVDGDGISLYEENLFGTSDAKVDSDDDGLTDYEELRIYYTSPTDPYALSRNLGWGELYLDYVLADLTDTDSDGLPDRVESHYGLNPANALDALGDLDGNGLTNLDQYDLGMLLNGDLLAYDADGDGMSDVFEIFHELNPQDPSDALADPDADGVLNFEEKRLSASPHHANSRGAGIYGDLQLLMAAYLYPAGNEPVEDLNANNCPDWAEAALTGTSFRFVVVEPGDLDGDGMPDDWEFVHGRWKYPVNGLDLRIDDGSGDADEDGVTNLHEYLIGTHPLISDSDQDGIEDGDEDADSDGLTNRAESALGLNPTLMDSDQDGILDGNSSAPNDMDRDGLSNTQETVLGKNPQWKDHPAAGLSSAGLTFP